MEYAWAYLPEKEGLLSTTEWCRKNGITECPTVEELCRKSDNILILAPSDPQVHLMLAERVLPFGKTTYIDKTFAESAEYMRLQISIIRKSFLLRRSVTPMNFVILSVRKWNPFR